MEPFEFNCPICGNKISVENQYRGMEAQCPYCDNSIKIPSETIPLNKSTVNEKNNAFKKIASGNALKKWKIKESKGTVILRVIKILLFLVSCFFFVNSIGIMYNHNFTHNYPSSEGIYKYGKYSYSLRSEYEVGVADSTYATYKNSQNIAENTNRILSLTDTVIYNTYITANRLDCIERKLNGLFVWFISIFFLLLSIFIDKIFLLQTSKK